MVRNRLKYTIDKNILDRTPFPTFVLSQDGKAVVANGVFKDLFGYSLEDFNHTNSLKNHFLSALSGETWEKILQNQKPLRLSNLQVISIDDTLIETSLVSLPSIFNGEDCISITFLPNSSFDHIEISSNGSSDLTKGLQSSFMMVTIDSEGFIINCNQLFLKTSHWTPKRIIGKSLWQLFPDKEESAKVTQDIWKTLSSGSIWQGEVEKITKDNQSYWVYLTAIPTYSETEQKNQYILIEKDITNEKTWQQQLERIAYIDPETGLMNAHRLEKVVSEMIEENRRFTFVYLSIDKFYTLKELQIENNLIIEFTKRLKIYFQDSLMTRINENEFVVITPLGDWFIQGFLTYLKQNPIYNGSSVVPITVSGGITRSPEDQSNFTQLMNASLTTINIVRDAGGDNIVSLSNATHKALNRKAVIEKRLLLALDQKNLKVLYQPQVELKSGKISVVEALVRWEDEEIGVVSPDELIPIAEETGLINNIGSFMIEEACKQAAEWKIQGLDLKVSINLSVREFRDKNMAKSILNILSKTGCPGNLIQIEITEKFALEAEAETSIIKQMRKLENEGIVFVLDDFGTGYASFRYMQLLPIEILKIDQTFINGLLKSEKTRRLINGMVQFGKTMNLKVLAEGVETQEQKQLLTEYGCDAIQGFVISKPISEDEIVKLVEK